MMKQIPLTLLLCLVVVACANKKKSNEPIDGHQLYKQNCILCHGPNGALGANGSKDLSKSTLSLEERKAIIKNGRGAMIGLGSILTDTQIAAIAEYTFKLNQ